MGNEKLGKEQVSLDSKEKGTKEKAKAKEIGEDLILQAKAIKDIAMPAENLAIKLMRECAKCKK